MVCALLKCEHRHTKSNTFKHIPAAIIAINPPQMFTELNDGKCGVDRLKVYVTLSLSAQMATVRFLGENRMESFIGLEKRKTTGTAHVWPCGSDNDPQKGQSMLHQKRYTLLPAAGCYFWSVRIRWLEKVYIWTGEVVTGEYHKQTRYPKKAIPTSMGGRSPDAERGLIFNFSILWCNLSKIDLRTGYYKVSIQQKFVRGKENKLVL